MKTLTRGTYLGTQRDSLSFQHITISRTDYLQKENQNWHCHENPFFAYFLKGSNREFRQSQEIKCSPGDLLFYKAGEIHRNKDYSPGCRIFHLEVERNWLAEQGIDEEALQTGVISYPDAKNTFVTIIQEFFIKDDLTESSVLSQSHYLFNLITRYSQSKCRAPDWKHMLDTILKENSLENPCLKGLAKRISIHPVTLSREFPKYYHCSFGDYIRQIRIERSLPLLSGKSIPLDEIAELCGFSDTSNFIRTFKKLKGTTPDKYRKLLQKQTLNTNHFTNQ